VKLSLTPFFIALVLCWHLPGFPSDDIDQIHPELDGVEPALVEQIQSARAMIDDLADGPAAELAEAWGEVGMLYQALELNTAALAAYANASRIHWLDGRWPYLSGMIEAELGSGDRARQHFLIAMALQPRLAASAWTRIGRLLLDMGEPEQALIASDKALGIDDQSAAALAVRGEALLALEQHEPAREALLKALKIEPRANRLRYPLAMAHRALGDQEAMRRELERSGTVGVVPDDPVADYLAEHARGSRIHTLRARQAFRAGDHAAALRLFERASQSAPDDPVVWINLGVTQAELGQTEQAVNSLERALALAPDRESARLNLAELYRGQGRSEAAWNVLSASEAKLDSQEALLTRARLGRELGHLEVAAADYLLWLETRKDLEVWSEAISLLLELGRLDAVFELATHPQLNAEGRASVASLAQQILERPNANLAELALAAGLSEHLTRIDPGMEHARLRVQALLATRPDCQAALNWLMDQAERAEPEEARQFQELTLALARQPRCRNQD